MNKDQIKTFRKSSVKIRYRKYVYDKYTDSKIKIYDEAVGTVSAITNQFVILKLFGTHKEIPILIEYIDGDIEKVDNKVL